MRRSHTSSRYMASAALWPLGGRSRRAASTAPFFAPAGSARSVRRGNTRQIEHPIIQWETAHLLTLYETRWHLDSTVGVDLTGSDLTHAISVRPSRCGPCGEGMVTSSTIQPYWLMLHLRTVWQLQPDRVLSAAPLRVCSHDFSYGSPHVLLVYAWHVVPWCKVQPEMVTQVHAAAHTEMALSRSSDACSAICYPACVQPGIRAHHCQLYVHAVRCVYLCHPPSDVIRELGAYAKGFPLLFSCGHASASAVHASHVIMQNRLMDCMIMI